MQQTQSLKFVIYNYYALDFYYILLHSTISCFPDFKDIIRFEKTFSKRLFHSCSGNFAFWSNKKDTPKSV